MDNVYGVLKDTDGKFHLVIPTPRFTMDQGPFDTEAEVVERGEEDGLTRTKDLPIPVGFPGGTFV